MIKKIVATLVGIFDQRKNLPATRFKSEQKDRSKLEHEVQEQKLRDDKKEYAGEETIPSESEILGPSDSDSEKA